MPRYSIYLFRHGESTFNRQHRFTGWYDARLTDKGRQDAEKIAEKLRGKRIDIAIHTSLTRSKETLDIVLKYHPEVKRIIIDDRMRERNYGDLNGVYHATYQKMMGERLLHLLQEQDILPRELHAYDAKRSVEELGHAMLMLVRRTYAIPPPGGESIRDVEKRVRAFIRDLLRLIKRERVNVAISAHGNSMRPFRRYFERLSIEEMMRLENPWDDYFEYHITV